MKPAIIDIVGVGPAAAAALAEHGFSSLASVAGTTIGKLAEVPGFSEARAAKVIAAAAELLPEGIKTGEKKAGKDKDKKKGRKDKKGKDKKKGKKDKKGKKGKGKK